MGGKEQPDGCGVSVEADEVVNSKVFTDELGSNT